jgi:hypothetical protein
LYPIKDILRRRPARAGHLVLLLLAVCLPAFLRVGPASGADAVHADQVADHAARPAAVRAVSSASFLSSLGVNTHNDQGYNPVPYVAMLQYTGIGNIRDGIRNLSGYVMLHEKAGIHVDIVGVDVTGLTTAAKTLAAADALLALEGPNEPNNFPITYNGQRGGADGSWAPVAQLQKDIYRTVKADPALYRYPVFHVSEGGAETENVGLQFLTIPKDADALFPGGTEYADYANPHNYVIGNGGMYEDNQAWKAADPVLNGRWDGLYGEYGKTWAKGFHGYPNGQLQTLPRVTTETGWDSVENPGGERVQGTILVNTYLAQFKRGWRYTFIYELRDNEGGAGHQGLYREDGTPKPSATFIHNLTSILADKTPVASPRQIIYTIADAPGTVHDLLLQKSNGTFELVVWGERVTESNDVTVKFSRQYPSIRIYDVTVGTTPVQTLTNVSAVPLTLTDHAMIIEVQ